MLLHGAAAGHAQEIPADAAGAPAPEDDAPSLPADELRRIVMDIDTSTLSELAAWCRSLGLSEGGDANSLRNSLRKHYKIPVPAGKTAQADARKIITIESARSTEYFRVDAVNEEYARLTDDVRVTLKDGDATHIISARDILFNRTRNIITAQGGVEYKKIEGTKEEIFRGDSITVNIDNWESIFLGGISRRSVEGTAYLFSGTVISRDDEDVTILTRGSIRGADNEESLWSLTASRIWLLPGSDFAILNAVLKVGEIPMLYIPYFYFPADEIVFHPVIGNRSREGNFVQTTTYLLGRPKASSASESSLTRILGNSNDMEKTREGIFLRSTGKPVKNASDTSLSLMLDYYTNLGFFGGLGLKTPKFGILNASELNLGFGRSRTLYNIGDGWTPFFAPNYDGEDWNKSNFFGWKEAPFRYRLNLNTGISGKYGSLSVEIPYLSDPLFERDFLLYRAEDMDWINMIKKGAAIESAEISDASKPTYTWTFGGQLTPKFPDMSPFISSISINRLSSNVSFNSKSKNNSASDSTFYPPNTWFYFPTSSTLYNTGLSISGKPVSIGGQNAGIIKPQVSNQQEAEIRDPLEGIGTPFSPWEREKEESDQVNKDSGDLVPPVLSQTFTIRKAGTTNVSLSYSLAPTSNSELQFNSSKWNDQADVDWGDIESVLTSFSGNANLSLNLNHSDNMYSGSFALTGDGRYSQYSYINEEAERFASSVDPKAAVDAAREQQFKNYTNFKTNYNLNLALSPFYLSNIWKSTKLSYTFNALAAKSGDFIGTVDKPEWKIETGNFIFSDREWNKNRISSHQVSMNLAANVMEKNQELSFSAYLPPLDSRYTANAALRIWITETTANVTMRNLKNIGKQDIGDEKKPKLDPLSITERITFGTLGSLSGTLVLENENKEFTPFDLNSLNSLNVTLSTSSKIGLSAGYTANRTRGYTLGPTGWVTSTGDLTFKPNSANIAYNKTFSQDNLFNNRFKYTFSINPRLNFNLLQYTSSSFSLGLNFGMTISKFLEFTMGFNTANSVIYRYAKDWKKADGTWLLPDLPDEIRVAEGEQYDLFTDLWNSFRFDDDARRKSSGFKMQNFSLSATHFLGDWDATLSLSMSPFLPTGSREYQLNTDFSFLVRWKPINEIKTDIKYNKKDDRWTVE